MSENDQESPTKFELYKVALDTRNMEIALFWQRSNYFLVLNTAIGVAYFLKASEPYQIPISLFGLAVAILWFCINLGSKFWQSRWEWRLKKAEEALNVEAVYFSAPWELIKQDVKESINFSEHGLVRRQFDKLVLLKPSVSFIMTLLSLLFVLLWSCLLIMAVLCNT